MVGEAAAKAVGGDYQAESVGFVSVAVDGSVVPCDDALYEAGWQEDSTPARVLEQALIKLWWKELGGKRVAAYSFRIGSMGQPNAAMHTATFLARCNRVRTIFLCGIAGSLKGTVKVGDVVIGSNLEWRPHDGLTQTAELMEYRNANYPVSGHSDPMKQFVKDFGAQGYRDAAAQAGREMDFGLHTGEIFSWDYVLNSEKEVVRLNKEHSRSLCIETEGGGFLGAVGQRAELTRAAHAAFVVRGISSQAWNFELDQAARRRASLNASRVAVTLAETLMTGAGAKVLVGELGQPRRRA